MQPNNYPPVLAKKDFTLRYERGEFGNKSPTWLNPADFMRSGYLGLVHLRNKIAGGETHYNLSRNECLAKWLWFVNREDWYVSAMAPTKLTLLQGEVQRGDHNGLDLYYTTVAKPMREALAVWARQVSGTIALSILQRFLCPNSCEWINVLLDRYPDHVIEFSCYDCEWGTLPGFNTVFWEIRKY